MFCSVRVRNGDRYGDGTGAVVDDAVDCGEAGSRLTATDGKVQLQDSGDVIDAEGQGHNSTKNVERVSKGAERKMLQISR